MNTPVVACVEVGNYLGRGAEYVAKLRAGVARHLKEPYTFMCLTDDERRHPGDDPKAHGGGAYYVDIPSGDKAFKGWWAKLYLFSGYRFGGSRVLYMDLDTVVVGDLAPLLASKGIIHLAHWGWKKNDYGSGVMVWDDGEHEEVWTRCPEDVSKRFRGDQDWLTHLGGWPALPVGLAVSYRYHCAKQGKPPAGASVVCFHGEPRPHVVLNDWMSKHWSTE